MEIKKIKLNIILFSIIILFFSCGKEVNMNYKNSFNVKKSYNYSLKGIEASPAKQHTGSANKLRINQSFTIESIKKNDSIMFVFDLNSYTHDYDGDTHSSEYKERNARSCFISDETALVINHKGHILDSLRLKNPDEWSSYSCAETYIEEFLPLFIPQFPDKLVSKNSIWVEDLKGTEKGQINYKITSLNNNQINVEFKTIYDENLNLGFFTLIAENHPKGNIVFDAKTFEIIKLNYETYGLPLLDLMKLEISIEREEKAESNIN